MRAAKVTFEDPLKPTQSLILKLGSLMVHVEEMKEYTFDVADKRYSFDSGAIDSILKDAEVVEWRKRMNELALLPRKRDA